MARDAGEIMNAHGYAAPRSLDEALALLAGNPGARVLAGGHSLLVEPKRRSIGGALLVDLGRIEGLAGIETAEGGLKIGAMTTLAAIAASEAVAAAFPALADAARETGDAQLRNRATLGGSLVSADAGGLLSALALALGVTLKVRGPKGARTISIDDAPGRTPLAAGEVVIAIHVPRAARSGAAYASVRNPATLAPICAVAAAVSVGGDRSITACRVAVGGATERPARLASVEKAITGQKPDADALSKAAGSAADGLTFRGDLFGSADYRAHLTRVLTRRALKAAAERAAR